MEKRKNETENARGICHKLFNYLAEGFPLYNIKQIDLGREDEVMRKPTTGPALDVPVEHIDMIFPKSSVPEDVRKTKNDSATPQKPDIHGTTFVEVAKPSVDQPQENNHQAKILRPRKPVMRAVSNIDKKSDLFIQKRRESFPS